MAVKKKFPYRAAFVACSGQCREEKEQHSEKQKQNCPEDSCKYGCIACGKCAEICKFGAITVRGGAAFVDEAACIACGRCVKECPREIIHIHECANYIVVRCSNKEKGKGALVCSSSCIGCGMCERVCTAGAVRVADNCAVIDEKVCLSCGMCAVKCSRHVIADLRGILTE